MTAINFTNLPSLHPLSFHCSCYKARESMACSAHMTQLSIAKFKLSLASNSVNSEIPTYMYLDTLKYTSK